MKRYLALMLSVMVLVSMSAPCFAEGWLIYSKPEFRGKVIDAETKEPIEGAVVVAAYRKTIIRLAPHSFDVVKDVRETLTSRDGTFHIPPYTSITDPLSFDFHVTFIIYKPGYGNFPTQQKAPKGLRPPDHERFFTEEIGSKGRLKMGIIENNDYEVSDMDVTFGIVELPGLRTKAERLNAQPSEPGGVNPGKVPLLYKLLNEERARYGLDKVGIVE